MDVEAREQAGSSVTEDPRWWLIVARDKSADGSFWYSVASTGVYCRPSCASRRANPKNVAIHDSAEDARRAGFRACRRCNPDGVSTEALKVELVVKICRLIEASDEVPSLGDLAGSLQLSAGYLHRIFKAHTGLTPKGYAEGNRASRVRKALTGGSAVTAAIYDAGFNSSGRFYEQSHAMLGMTPSRFRAGGSGEELRFAIGETSLGAILVASSAAGIAAILLGDDPQALARDLQNRFPAASLIGADREYEAVIAAVVGIVEAPQIGLNLPLDLRGTAFQRRVWQALQAIPTGETMSYAEIARRIGAPNAMRAVAGACAANRHAVAIPCHRVVRSDGSLSGYVWGVERKQAILDRERTTK